MSKYIDSNETRRLSRLKNVKSSIGSKMSHSGWLKRQIEKRRLDKLRQQKEEAKRKPLGNGIQVDTKISKSDAVSKCGLKLKVTKEQGEMSSTALRSRTTQEKPAMEAPRWEVRDKSSDICRSNSRISVDLKTNSSGVSSTSAPVHDSTFSMRKQPPTKPTKRTSFTRLNDHDSLGCGSNQQSSQKENKRHHCNSTNVESIHKDVVEHSGSTKKSSTTSKKFFMDIDSLRREHASAIKMLKELDIKEGYKRRSIVSSNDHSTGSIPGEEDGIDNSNVEMHTGSMYGQRARSDDDFAVDDESTDDEYSNSRIRRRSNSSSVPGSEENSFAGVDDISTGRAGIQRDHQHCMIDDKFVEDHSTSICSSRGYSAGSNGTPNIMPSELILSADVDEANCAVVMAREDEPENALADDSFLNNMTHLSISLRDEFDNEGAEVEEYTGEDDEEVEPEECVPSPI